ncbi:DnaJ domain-containing protein [Enterocloster bolteae]|uniref:DnaJ domain-containing protein n=1 Tax=Enterocloster bolteae TaxID=208479 RepID=UPI002108C4DA|nr:DnaJ domain-containing protein [Enterocloster bolteae]MCQ5145778.1 J domain-containing protein [Enterocloster bolteae]
MDNINTLYNILGVSENASNETIQKSYDSLREAAENDIDEFDAINYAYSVLSDSEKRVSYDSRLKSDRLNLSKPMEIQYSSNTKKRHWGNIVIWVLWIIIYNIITVLLNIDGFRYGGAIGAFLYMTIFWFVGKSLCALWNNFKR